MRSKLALVDLRKRFEAVEAVRGVSLELEHGEFVSLLGPSGCGKSTTLAMIAGLEAPTGGDILVDGTSVVGVHPSRRRIGLVFQDYAVFSKLSVRGNLAFGLEAQRVPRAERRRRIAAIAERLALGGLLDRPARGLNMSEMQRIALARVLVTEPQLLLLDEPMSNLDAALRYELRSELKRIQQALGQTVLYVTHDQLEAISMSDRIAVMNEGALQQVGTPREIYDQPVNRFTAEFIGDPPINLLPCRIARDGKGLAATTALHGPIPLGQGEIAAGDHLLGIRPHDFRVSSEPSEGSAPTKLRLRENLGAEHVLHLEYGERLVAVTVTPEFHSGTEVLHLSLAAGRVLLIDSGDGRVVRRHALEECAA